MDDRTRAGEAYAVLTDGGELVFFRSEEEYEDGEIARARDVLGNEYEGVVYPGVETEKWSLDNKPEWHNKAFATARIADGQAIAPVSCAWWFSEAYDMVSCGLIGLDTSNVTDMSGMFHGCMSLAAAPDTSHWDTGNVKNMREMFFFCQSLATPPDTSRWDTSRVEDMFNMFEYCNSLKTPPNTSKWDTGNVKNMGCMFDNCASLATSPDTSGWDTSKVEDMSYMFNSCAALSVPPDMSGWDTSNIVNSDYMFCYCDSLETEPELTIPNRDGETR